MTFERQDPRSTVSTRVSDETNQRLEALEASKSAFIRQAILDALPPKDGAGIELPNDEKLAEGYRTLANSANESGWIPQELAETVLAKQLGESKEIVRYSVIEPLSKRGYVAIKPGLNRVRYRVIR